MKREGYSAVSCKLDRKHAQRCTFFDLRRCSASTAALLPARLLLPGLSAHMEEPDIPVEESRAPLGAGELIVEWVRPPFESIVLCQQGRPGAVRRLRCQPGRHLPLMEMELCAARRYERVIEMWERILLASPDDEKAQRYITRTEEELSQPEGLAE